MERNVKFCPICAAKKILHSVQLKPFEEEKYDKSACPTPPMGWSSWNLFRTKISEDLIKQIADAMADSGLRDAGYKFVNLDDCWQDSRRSETGKIQCDPYTFPSGIKSLVEYVNSKGLKLGIYSSNGTLTCEDYPASYGYERQDAETYAEWGVEYFKYDFCHHVPMPTEAPLVAKITFLCEDGSETEVFAKDAFFTGNARKVACDSIEGGYYIKGISSRNGTAIIDVTVKKEGFYRTTFTIKKEGKSDKFMLATVNGKDTYELTAPGTKSPSPEGKIHTDIKLNAGKNTIVLTNPIGSASEGYAYQYTRMGKELKRATAKYAEEHNVPEKKIVYSICEWGFNRPYKWGPVAGNLWRTTPDINASWLSILGIYSINVRLGKYAGVGSYNDPDMLEVGNGKLTYDENFSHFATWCMMSAPLILGNDIRKFIREDGSVDKENVIYKILTNKYLISIDQDKLCTPCKVFKSEKGVDTLAKPLENKRTAVCVFNKTDFSTTRTISFRTIAGTAGIGLESKGSYKIFDVRREEEFNSDFVEITLKPHACEVYIVE